MKRMIYILYALIFRFYKFLPLNKSKTTFIMTHDKSKHGNIMCMYEKIKKERPDEICKFITRDNLKHHNKGIRIFNQIKFIVISSFHLATSKVIFLDNIFLPMAYMKFDKDVKVVQLWHGCNTLKRFGQLSNKGMLKELEKRANACYTHVIVSSHKMKKLHEEAFGVEPSVIYALGLPRMDILFDDKDILEAEKQEFYNMYPELRDKKLILYAPTFRDDDLEMKEKRLDISGILKDLPKEYYLLTKYHPFICHFYKSKDVERVIDVSNYKDLNTLLLVADVLVTDYSSIIYEYAVLNKPMIFYAFDKEVYKHQIRGFYYDYEHYVPGKIVETEEDLVESLKEVIGHTCQHEVFVDKYLGYKDNRSNNRIFDEIYND